MNIHFWPKKNLMPGLELPPEVKTSPLSIPNDFVQKHLGRGDVVASGSSPVVTVCDSSKSSWYARFCSKGALLSWLAPSDAVDNVSKAALDRLIALPDGAGHELSSFLSAVAPVISNILRQQQQQDIFYQQRFHDITLCLLRSVVANVGGRMAKDHPETPITVVGMFEYLLQEVGGDLSAVQQALSAAGKIKNERARQKLIDTAMKPVIDKLVSICLAQGKDEIKFMKFLPSFIWKQLISKLSSNIIQVAHHWKHFDCLKPEESLKKSRTQLEEKIGPGIVLDEVNRGVDLLSNRVIEFVRQTVLSKVAEYFPAIGSFESLLWQKEDTYLSSSLKSTIIQLLFRALEGASTDPHNASKKGLVSFVLEKFGTTFQGYIEEYREPLLAAINQPDPVKRQQLFRQLFKPLSAKIFHLILGEKEHPLSLPFPSSSLDGIIKNIKEDFLPDFLAESLTPMASWMLGAEQDRAEIIDRTHNTYIVEGCRHLSDWITEIFPVLVGHERVGYSDSILANLKKMPQLKFLYPYLIQHEKAIKKLFSEEVFCFFESHSALITQGIVLCKPYFESIFLRIFNEILKTIDEKEQGNPDLLLHIGRNLLSKIHAHFKSLNSAVGKKTAIYGLSIPEALKGYQKTGTPLPLGVSEQSLSARRIARETIIDLAEKRKLLEKLTQANAIQLCEEEISLLKVNMEQSSHDQNGEYLNRITKLRSQIGKLEKKADLSNPSVIEKCRGQIAAAELRLMNAQSLEKTENNAFYEKFVKDLLDLRRQQDELPLPPHQTVSSFVFGTLLPNVFQGIIESIITPDNLHQMLSKGVEAFNVALDTQNAEDAMQMQVRIAKESLELLKRLKKEDGYFNKMSVINLKNTFSRDKDEIQYAIRSLNTAITSIKGWEVRSKDPQINKKIQQAEAGLASLKGAFESVFNSIESTELSANVWKERFQRLGALVSVVTTFEHNFNAISALIQEEAKLNAEDELQEGLDKKSGELIDELTKLIPKSMVKVLFDVFKLSNPSSRLIGRAFRRILSKELTLKTVIELGVKNILPSLMGGGKWVGEGAKMKFERDVSTEIPKDKDCPAVTDEVAKFRKMQEAELRLQALKDLMLPTVYRSYLAGFKWVSQQIQNGFRILVNWICHQLGIFIDFLFRGYAPKIRRWAADVARSYGDFKQMLSEGLEKIKENPVYRIAAWLLNLPFKLLALIRIATLDLHFKAKINQLLKSVSLDLHQILLFNLLNGAVNLETES